MGREIWKPIKGFEGYYEVSNKGRVKSLKRLIQRSYKSRPTKGFEKPQKIMTPANNGKGYLWVYLAKEGKAYHKYIHRLVATAFVENSSVEKNQINHKDGNKQNNVASNLEWCTARENDLHRYNVLMKRNPYKGKEVPWNCKKNWAL